MTLALTYAPDRANVSVRPISNDSNLIRNARTCTQDPEDPRSSFDNCQKSDSDEKSVMILYVMPLN